MTSKTTNGREFDSRNIGLLSERAIITTEMLRHYYTTFHDVKPSIIERTIYRDFNDYSRAGVLEVLKENGNRVRGHYQLKEFEAEQSGKRAPKGAIRKHLLAYADTCPYFNLDLAVGYCHSRMEHPVKRDTVAKCLNEELVNNGELASMKHVMFDKPCKIYGQKELLPSPIEKRDHMAFVGSRIPDSEFQKVLDQAAIEAGFPETPSDISKDSHESITALIKELRSRQEPVDIDPNWPSEVINAVKKFMLEAGQRNNGLMQDLIDLDDEIGRNQTRIIELTAERDAYKIALENLQQDALAGAETIVGAVRASTE